MSFKIPSSTILSPEILLLGAVLFAALPCASVKAQAPAQTGTGGGAATTVTAPNTSAVGRTMPRGGGADAEMERNLDRRTPQQAKDDEISKGICIGCNK